MTSLPVYMTPASCCKLEDALQAHQFDQWSMTTPGATSAGAFTIFIGPSQGPDALHARVWPSSRANEAEAHTVCTTAEGLGFSRMGVQRDSSGLKPLTTCLQHEPAARFLERQVSQRHLAASTDLRGGSAVSRNRVLQAAATAVVRSQATNAMTTTPALRDKIPVTSLLSH
jgi:hypothetical protein